MPQNWTKNGYHKRISISSMSVIQDIILETLNSNNGVIAFGFEWSCIYNSVLNRCFVWQWKMVLVSTFLEKSLHYPSEWLIEVRLAFWHICINFCKFSIPSCGFFLKRMMEIGLLVLLERASIQVNSTELDQRYWFSLCYIVIPRIQIRWMIECRKNHACVSFAGYQTLFEKFQDQEDLT